MTDSFSDDRAARYIDTNEGLARVRNNKSLYKRMLNMFMDTNEFSEFEYQLSNKNYEEAAKTVHAIKGIAGNLSLPMLFETSNNLMVELRQGSVSEEMAALYLSTAERTRFAVKEAILQLDNDF